MRFHTNLERVLCTHVSTTEIALTIMNVHNFGLSAAEVNRTMALVDRREGALLLLHFDIFGRALGARQRLESSCY